MTRKTEVAVVHRRILSGPNKIMSGCHRSSSLAGGSNSFHGGDEFLTGNPSTTLQGSNGNQVRSSTQILLKKQKNEQFDNELVLKSSNIAAASDG